jgi:hypothetical protein
VKRDLLCDEFCDELFEPLNGDLIQNRGLQPQIVRDLTVEGSTLVAHDRFRIRANPTGIGWSISKTALQNNCSRELRLFSKNRTRFRLKPYRRIAASCEKTSNQLSRVQAGGYPHLAAN